jgi:hypothetical protein
MMGMHSASKGQREVVRQLVHSVLVRDMSSFNPERFKEWIKAMDTSFRKVGLTPHLQDPRARGAFYDQGGPQ